MEGDDETVPLTIDPHPLLEARVFEARFESPLGELTTPAEVEALFALEAPAPMKRDEDCRGAVRDLLRYGGYKPTGRGKPAAEYLVRAAGEGKLGSINLAVDLCNVVSLHSGLPISVVDLDRAAPPFRIGIAEPGTRYVFNASDQEIDVGGLLCLFDAEGPSANAVKDSQRTKTHAETARTLCVVWGTSAAPGRADETVAWYRALHEQAGVSTSLVTP
jgi:DNA/RNA-binding domain of Phe-tRNA-synthetase-like protein